MLKSAFGGLSTGVCRQPQWSYVGVFMYSLAGWSCNGEIGLGTWVGLCHSLREKYNSRGYSFLMFTGISAENLSLYPRGTIPHIIPNYTRAHYNAGLNTSAAVCRRRYLVSVRNLSIRCACNQMRVCRRKCSGRRLPNESVPTEVFWLAASDGSVQSGGFRHFILLPQIPLLRLFLNLPVSG